MLGILAELGMVERLADGSARAGAGLATLTRRVDRSPAVVREQLRPLAAELERTYGENAAVGIDDGSGFHYLVSVRVPSAVQVADPVGETFPYHLVAPGLVCMSHWDDDRLARYLTQPLAAATARSVTRVDLVQARLRRIRHDGYAWTDQELDDEVNGLAAPIRDSDGALVGVATLYGPSYRFAEALHPTLGPAFAELVAERTANLLTSE
jgi:DNA-binding IclR family transcriptional regulator